MWGECVRCGEFSLLTYYNLCYSCYIEQIYGEQNKGDKHDGSK